MANEITVSAILRLNNVSGGLPPVRHGGVSQTFTQTTKQKVSGVLACTSTPATITLTALTAKGWAYFQNLSSTTAVTVQADDGSGYSDAFVFPASAGYMVYLANASTYQGKTASGTASLLFECYDA